MKHFILLILYILTFSSLTNAQSNKINDLEIKLEQSNEIEKIKILNQLSDLYKTSDPFKSYSYAQQALKLSISNDYLPGQILAHEYIGIFFQFTGQYSKALENYFKVNELIEKTDGDSLLLMKNNNLLGEVYRDLKEYDQALEYYNSALEISKIKEKFSTQIVINVNIALVYIEKENFDKAITISKEALQLSENNDYLFGVMISKFNIGLVNSRLGKHDLAIDNFQELENMVVQYGEQLGTEFTLGKIKLFQAIAESYYALHNFDCAHKYAIKCWELANNSDYKLDFKKINDFLYTFYLQEKNHKEALKYFELSYKLNDELKSEKNNRQLLLLETLEKERIQTIASNLEKEKKERRFRLEYIGISVVILIIFLSAAIFGRYQVSKQLEQAIVFLSFLLLFEFVLVLIDPSLEVHTSGEPVYKMIANSFLAIIFTFLHRFFEKKISFKSNKLNDK